MKFYFHTRTHRLFILGLSINNIFAFLKLMDGPLFLKLMVVPFIFGLSISYIFAFLKLMDGPLFLKLMDGPFLFCDYS